MQDQQQDKENDHHNSQVDHEQHTNGATNRKREGDQASVHRYMQQSLGRASSKTKNWITSDTWKKIDERRDLKRKLNQAVTGQQKRQAQREYSEKHGKSKEVAKITYANKLAREAEAAAGKGDDTL